MEKSVKAASHELEGRAAQSRAAPPLPVKGNPVTDIFRLQRTVGNGAVGSLLNGGRAGRFRIGPAGDLYEHEADRVADRIMWMPEPAVQRKPT